MAENNSGSFKPPKELELPASTSTCSMDVSVLSAGSSLSSFGSISHFKDPKSQKAKLHRKTPSLVKFNNYRRISGRWNESLGGGMNMQIYPSRHTGSQTRLSNPRLSRLSVFDVPILAPCRKCSMDGLSSTCVQDGPASVPIRKESKESVISAGTSIRATAALHRLLNKGSKAKNKNFEWKASSSARRVSEESDSLAFSAMLGTGFCFNPPRPSGVTSHPPAIPQRRESVPEFNSLNAIDCTCKREQPPLAAVMMPPPSPSPARQLSLMDFDQIFSSGDSNILPPPPSLSTNQTWSAHSTPRIEESLKSTSDHVSQNMRREMFLAMPPITRFERASSQVTAASSRCLPPSLPIRRGSVIEGSPASGTPMPCMASPNTTGAPPVPQRKESYMDINDVQS